MLSPGKKGTLDAVWELHILPAHQALSGPLLTQMRSSCYKSSSLLKLAFGKSCSPSGFAKQPHQSNEPVGDRMLSAKPRGCP